VIPLLVVELLEEIVDLDLLGLERVLELGELSVILGDEGGGVGGLVPRRVVGSFVGELEIPLESIELVLLTL